MSATAYTLSVSPRQVKNSEALARLLSPVIGVDAETIRRRASDTTKGGVTLKRQLPYAATQQLKLMMADGAIVEDISGADRAQMTVDDLVALFKTGTGRALDNDRMLLSD